MISTNQFCGSTRTNAFVQRSSLQTDWIPGDRPFTEGESGQQFEFPGGGHLLFPAFRRRRPFGEKLDTCGIEFFSDQNSETEVGEGLDIRPCVVVKLDRRELPPHRISHELRCDLMQCASHAITELHRGRMS